MLGRYTVLPLIEPRVRKWARAPRRRGRHIVRGDFFQKSPLTHFVAAPFQIEPASLGFDLIKRNDAVFSVLLTPPKPQVTNHSDVLIAKNVFALVYRTAVYGR